MQVYWGFGEFGCPLYRATFELDGVQGDPICAKEEEDEEEDEDRGHQEGCSPHHLDILEFIDKMAPLSPCSNNHEDKKIPSTQAKEIGT